MLQGNVAPPNPGLSHSRAVYGEPTYRAFVDQEKRNYETCSDVHDLPPIFHYWSQRHLRPALLRFGLADPNSLFTNYLEK